MKSTGKYFLKTIILVLLIFCSFSIYGQTLGCNFKPGTIQLSLIGQSQGNTIESYVVLVDGGNIIRYKSSVNTGTINAVNVGSYKAIAITWDKTQANIPSVEVGKNISDVNHCWKSTSLDISICDCNTSTNSITVPVTAGISPRYILTDGKGIIQQIQTSTTFSGLSNGIYNQYTVCETGMNIEVGSRITTIPNSNFCNIIPLSYVVCLLECEPIICAPLVVSKIR